MYRKGGLRGPKMNLASAVVWIYPLGGAAVRENPNSIPPRNALVSLGEAGIAPARGSPWTE